MCARARVLHCARAQIRLLVIDSIGALYRLVAEESSAPRATAHGERAQHAMRLAARLKAISNDHNVTVVVTNQVSDKPLDQRSWRTAAAWERGPCAAPDRTSVRAPALGIAWSGCVNTRLVLTRQAAAADGSWSRALHVAWSPRTCNTSVAFHVRDWGLVGVEGSVNRWG